MYVRVNNHFIIITPARFKDESLTSHSPIFPTRKGLSGLSNTGILVIHPPTIIRSFTHYSFQMKTQLTDFNLSTSIWQLLQSIDDLLTQPAPLTTRLEQTAKVLVEAVDVDALWFLTISPLPALTCGIVRTPLTIAPDAKIYMSDKAPPIAEQWPESRLLKHVITYKTPLFLGPDSIKGEQVDADLGDILFATFNILPAAVVPLVADKVSLGVIVIGNKVNVKPHFSDEMQEFLTYLGKHLGKNLQNAYLVEHSQRHSHTLLTLNQIAQTITSSLDIDDVIQRTMAGINRVLDVEAGSLLLVDDETDELYFKITLRGENRQVASFRLAKGEGVAGWVVANNRPAIINQPAVDKRFSPKIDQAIGFKTQTMLCVPLIVQGRAIGVLELLNKRAGFFNQDDQELLVSMAAALGIALRNAILFEEAQERVHINEVINEITAVINAGHGLSETAKLIVKQFHRLFGFDHISVSLLDNSTEKIRQWSFNENGYREHIAQSISLEGSELANIMQDAHGNIIADISALPVEYPDNKILLVDNIRSKMVVPLTTHKTPSGSLSVGSRQIDAYGPQELKHLEQLTPQLAIAIDKAMLIDTMEQRAGEMQLLNRLGEMLVSTTDLNLILDTALNMLPRMLPGNAQGLIVVEDERAYIGAAIPYGFQHEQQILNSTLSRFFEISDNSQSLEIISSKSVAGNMPVESDWKPVTTLSLPILTRQGIQGLVYLASGKEETFNEDVLRILSLIVSQISAAIANAHLFHQVEQERARLAAILNSITDAVLVVNRNGRIVLDNPTARDVMDVEESKNGRLLVESTGLRPLIKLFEDAMQGGNPTGELALQDGRTFFANLSPVSIGGLDVTGWVATMQDVSHFKELNELKNDFVSSVSHDLRSPLSTILLAINLVAEAGTVNKDQQDLLNAVDRQVRAMSDLIEDILDVGKIEAGIDMEMELCKIGPIIDTVTTTLLPQAADKTIRLDQCVEENLPAVLANSTRLQQVLYNLVGNAIKYTPSNGLVTVKAYPQDGEMRIQVVDTGLGIPPADQPRIFEKFYRVQGEHMTHIKGSGLGLAITKGIVEKHHGRIWLESVFGKGSTFTVALPIFNEEAPFSAG